MSCEPRASRVCNTTHPEPPYLHPLQVKKEKADAQRTTDMYTKHFNQQVG